MWWRGMLPPMQTETAWLFPENQHWQESECVSCRDLSEFCQKCDPCRLLLDITGDVFDKTRQMPQIYLLFIDVELIGVHACTWVIGFICNVTVWGLCILSTITHTVYSNNLGLQMKNVLPFFHLLQSSAAAAHNRLWITAEADTFIQDLWRDCSSQTRILQSIKKKTV